MKISWEIFSAKESKEYKITIVQGVKIFFHSKSSVEYLVFWTPFDSLNFKDKRLCSVQLFFVKSTKGNSVGRSVEVISSELHYALAKNTLSTVILLSLSVTWYNVLLPQCHLWKLWRFQPVDQCEKILRHRQNSLLYSKNDLLSLLF